MNDKKRPKSFINTSFAEQESDVRHHARSQDSSASFIFLHTQLIVVLKLFLALQNYISSNEDYENLMTV
jgi:hypothetical protein